MSGLILTVGETDMKTASPNEGLCQSDRMEKKESQKQIIQIKRKKLRIQS